MRLSLLFPALVTATLVGCSPQPTCTVVTIYPDVDRDGFGDGNLAEGACDVPLGYARIPGDCDDRDSTVGPDAEEVCDGSDNDCDGRVDEDLPSRWFRDADGDGWGDDDTLIEGCAPPAGATDRGGDCDDLSAAISPDAEERCNARDDDCDGSVDEDVADAPTWFLDADGDGHGDPGAAIRTCERLPGYATEGEDCDDDDPLVHPGANELCDDIDNDCNGLVDDEDDGLAGRAGLFTDGDEDGWGAEAAQACHPGPGVAERSGDCDDDDPRVHPEAVEVCGHGDDDCNGLADDDDPLLDPATASAFYTDGDGDGFGDAVRRVWACEQPPGTSTSHDDCNDDDPTIHPGATEVCGGWDEDCDGRVDDEDDDVDPTTFTTFWHDGDYDSWGAPGRPIEACATFPGRVENDEDCDDTDYWVSPGQVEVPYDRLDNDCDPLTPDDDLDGDGLAVLDGTDCDDTRTDVHVGASEICDEVDNNCNGLADDDDPLVEPDTFVRSYFDGDADGTGDAERWVESCVPPPGYVLAGGDCDDDDPMSPVATAWFHDSDGDGFGAGEPAGPSCAPPAEDWVPITLTLDCDDDDPTRFPGQRETCGDGVDDSCSGEDGRCHAPLEGLHAIGDAPLLLTGETWLDHLGSGAAYAGSVDGDGSPALVLGASGHSLTGIDAGAAYLVRGPHFDTVPVEDAAHAVILGEAADQHLGYDVAGLGDVDGDGYDDVLLGAPLDDSGGEDAGAAWVVFGPVSGVIGIADPALRTAKMTGELPRDHTGTNVEPAGDLNGDGLADLLLGSGDAGYLGAGSGMVHLVHGPPEASLSLLDADARLVPEAPGDRAGDGLSGGGDIDGDGLVDVLIGAPGSDQVARNAGAAYLMSGPLVGTLWVADASFVVRGEMSGDGVGAAVALEGDLDGDGAADVVLGAPGDDTLASNAGRVLIVERPPPRTELPASEATAVLLGVGAGHGFGSTLAVVGDVNGDGADDLWVGAEQLSNDGSTTGGAALFLGPIAPGAWTIEESAATLWIGGAGGQLGHRVGAAGDLDTDGIDDLLVTAHTSSHRRFEAGLVAVIFGASP